MKLPPNKVLLESLRDEISNLEGEYISRRELETQMEVVATAIYRLLEDNALDMPDSLSEAIYMLPITAKAKRTLDEICSEIQSELERADYDRGDEDEWEETIEQLKSDFCEVLNSELDKLNS